MKGKRILLVGALLLACATLKAAPLGTAISYQGRLDDSGNPANGTYSFRYRLLADPNGTTPIGSVVDLPSQPIAGGLLNAQLDFGATAFTGDARWLEISVKPGNPSDAGEYIKLNPQPLPPAPSSQFARVAGDVLNGVITGAKLAPLAITTTHISDGSITAPKLGPSSVTTGNVSDNAVTAAKIASGQVVKSFNGLHDNVTISPGANISFTPSGNNIQISASGTLGSLALPFTGSASAPAAAFHANNTGTSAASDGLSGTTASSAAQVAGVRGTATSSSGVVVGLYGVAVNSAEGTGVVGKGGATGGYFTSTAPGGRAGVFDGTVTVNGNVGIGGTAPGHKLEVSSPVGTAIVGRSTAESGTGVFGESAQFEGVRGEGNHINHGAVVGVHKAGGWGMYGLSSGNGIVGESTAAGAGVFGRSAGWDGVHGETSAGTASGVTGVNFNSSGGVGVFGESRGAGIGVSGKSASFEGVHGETTSPTFAAVAGINLGSGPGVYGRSDGNGYGGYFLGKVRVGVLEIAGGVDLAEPFPMKEAAIEKGSVVVIDEEHPGRLKRSTQAYDTRVAGIISGANGINPGISLTQEGSFDQGEKVALTGRVYVQADAGNGAIKPGDLLTTSDTPGHAMKVNDSTRAQGAILGKAMTALAQGKGMVLVLVTLQ